jgi:hypothetical protein
VAVGVECVLAVGSHLAVHRGFHPIRGGLFWHGVRTEQRQRVVRDIFVGLVTAMTVSVGNGRRHRHPSPLTAVVACQALFWHGVRTEQRQRVVRDIFVGFVKAMTVSVGNGRRHRHPSPLTAVVACQAIRRRCPFCPPNRCMHLRTSAHRRPEGGSSTHLLAPAGNLSTRLSAAPRNLVEVFHPECAFGAQPTWASALPAPQRYGAVTRVACRATVEWSPDRPPQQPQLGLQPLRAYQNHHRENPQHRENRYSTV